jgi:pimeloyl-ACP methyl ester carboxylesterase
VRGGGRLDGDAQPDREDRTDDIDGPTPSTCRRARRHDHRTDLRALLQSIGEVGPYVLVGHSFGGAEAVSFTSSFPADVSGLLLLDASPITWAAAVCSVSDDGSEAARNFQVGCATQSDPANNVEHLDVPTSFAAVADIASLGAVPMIVATAADHPFAGLAATETARLNDVWNAGQQHWTSLSSDSQLVAIDDTSHDIQLDQPGAVMDQIRELLP